MLYPVIPDPYSINNRRESTAIPGLRYHQLVPGIFYTLVFLATSMAGAPLSVEVVLDGSQTMLTPVAGSTIQAMVQDAIMTVVAEAEAQPGQLKIGLRVAGGSATGDDPCSVSDPLVSVGDPDWGHWTKALNGMKPQGKRPLVASVADAITDVARDEGKSRVVVITTGADQCESDLQDVAAALAATDHSVELRLVGLNLDSTTIESFGSLEQRNATSPAELLEAIRWGILEIDDPERDGASPEPTPTEIPAMLSAPDRIAAGESFQLSWSGPEGPEDYLSLAPEGSTDDRYLDWARVEEGNPTPFTAPLDPGAYELRYVDGETGEIRARTSLEVIAVSVELQIPPTATAGLRFEVAWTANASDGEFVAISKSGSSVVRYLDWATTAAGSPTTLAAPLKPGIYEVRYYSKGGREILSRAEIEVRP